MTDNDDNTNDELPISAQALLHQETMHEDNDSDFAEDEEGLETASDDLESAGGDLTPNDIFGLDPLDVLTLEEVAEYLKISAAAVRRVIKEQNLPGRNIGGEWRFLRDAVANWLRGQEAPAAQQQKAREDYSKPNPKPAPPRDDEGEQFSRPPRRPFQADQPSGGEYRPKQQFGEGRPQYGNQGGYGYQSGGNQGGGQYGNRGAQSGGGQYGNRGGQSGGGQYGGAQSGGGQYGSGRQSSGESYQGGTGGSYSQPPRRPFRSTEGGSSEDSRGATGGGGGYAGGAKFGGGGYAAGGQQYGGAPKRKNKRHVFENERGKRLDRRKEGDAPEGQE